MKLILNNQLKGSLYAIGSALFFAISCLFGSKIMKQNISVENMLFWRFLIAGTSLSGYLLFLDKRSFKIEYKKYLYILLQGLTFYSISSYLYFFSFKYVGSGLATVVYFTYSIFVMLLSYFFEQAKISKFYFIAAILIILGLILQANTQNLHFDSRGIFTALLAAICYAIYIFINRNQQINPLVSTAIITLGSSLSFFLIATYNGSFKVPIGIGVWLNIVIMAILCTILPILFLLKSLRLISAAEASILTVSKPIFVIILGYLFLNEHLTISQIIGVFLILGAVMIVQFEKKFI